MTLLFAALLFSGQVWALGMVSPAATPAPLRYEDAQMSLNPLGYWRVGELSGTSTADFTGRNGGTYINTPTLGVDGLLVDNGDTAVDFNSAQTEYVSITDAPELNVVAPFTVIAWVDPEDTSGEDVIISKLKLSGGFPIPFQLAVTPTTGVLGFSTRDGGTTRTVSGTSDISVGGTHMCVGRLIGTSQRAFVDGIEEGEIVGANGSTSAPAILGIGARNGGNTPFDGIIDDVALLTDGLSLAQIGWLNRIGTGLSVFPGDYVSP